MSTEYKVSEVFDMFLNNDMSTVSDPEIAAIITKSNNEVCRKMFLDAFQKVDFYSFGRITNFLNNIIKKSYNSIFAIDNTFFGTAKDENGNDVDMTYDLFFKRIFTESKLPTSIKMQYLSYAENSEDINNLYSDFNNNVFGG